MYHKYEKIFSVILFILMCAGLGVLIYVGKYNHPTGDDYYYGADTVRVFRETGSIVQTFKAAVEGVIYQYYNWQGTYSAMLLMYLPPNIFGENAYRLVTAVILLLYAGCTFYALKPLLRDILGMNRRGFCICAASIVMLSVQTVQFAGESYFWYNGSMYYTGYFALTLFFLGLAFRFMIEPGRGYIPVLALLAIFLAGGNYVSLLPCILIMFTAFAVLLLRHSGKALPIGVVTALMTGGLLVSAAAPGNMMREEQLWEMSAWKAVLKSIRQGFIYTGAWTGIWWLITVLLITPCLWNAYGRLEFRHPVIVVGYLFGIFCSMSCPTFYAMNSTGPARAVAVVYYGFIFLSLAAYAYVLGALHGRFASHAGGSPGFWAAGLSAIIVLTAFQVFSGEIQECTGAKAIHIIISGEGVQYEKEYIERLSVLEDDSIEDVVFKPYTVQPEMLYVGDFTDDINNENNIKAAQYFGKNSLMVDYADY
ncbi:MAG: hypothetical protein LUG83_03120 [Lachnospiraceae bacterium]|nr:hypothetical protein [Lachnospiraceae bacterium]